MSPTAVPSMADAGAVLAGVVRRRRPGALRGARAQRAGRRAGREAGVDALTVTVSASAAYSEKNVKMTVEESMGRWGDPRPRSPRRRSTP